ncbi:MAG TPA: SMP-30/gluconolactonase/LRE family protein [Polyangiaceae bacterium]|nr:SMP-30/gluconolactonase/LRE family protein [Polyangiaceae bacterium]
MNAPANEPRPVANYHCEIGENPLWNPDDACLYWVDIATGRLFRARHADGAHECFWQGDAIGGFTLQADGSLLLFEADRIARLDLRTGQRRVLIEGIDPDMARFNDVIADPEGRVFAGTFGNTQESGGVYRIDPDGSYRCLWKGTQIANGMGFTRDLKRFFWTCSTTARIFEFDYDRVTGELSNRRLLYQAQPSEGSPDGLTVDSEDTIWTARWGGHQVLRLDLQGRVVSRLELPVPKVSSVTFGGPQLDTLYITTAGGDSSSTAADGTLYRWHAPVRGQADFRSRVLL